MVEMITENMMSSYERDLGCMEVCVPVPCADGSYAKKVCDDFDAKCVPALKIDADKTWLTYHHSCGSKAWTMHEMRSWLERYGFFSHYKDYTTLGGKFERRYYRYLDSKNAVNAQEKKETDMRNDISLSVASIQARDLDIEARDRLLTRVTEIYWAKDKVLEDKYFISSPKGPKTLGELKERLAKGQFTIDGGSHKDDYELECWKSIDHWLSWRLKGQEKDQKGFDEAHKALKDLREKTKDQIYTSAPADGLKALQSFEAATIK